MECRVISSRTELPRGSYFYTVPDLQLETGELALFAVGESPYNCEYTIVGRWYPDVAGYNWIQQPERWIRIAKDAIFWIVGRIVPIGVHRFKWSARSGLLVASSTLIEISSLVAPLLA